MSRLHLDSILHEVSNRHGNFPIYFKPPSGFNLKYPCLVYNPSGVDSVNANNELYIAHRQYELSFMTQRIDQEELIKDIVKSVPYGRIIREFETNGIQHTLMGCSDIY